ncbi:MAG: cation diffusion facilitator family transporter [Pseudorhodoplanes sp.]
MQDIKQKVALGSIAASAGLTIAKATVGALSGSLAILSEAAHSLIDFFATVITYFAVRVSGKPADDEHHYGHGKVESVAALAETALLFILAIAVIVEAGRRLWGEGGHLVQASIAAFAVIVGSIVVDFWRARMLKRVAKETASEALEADALHFSSDMWSSAAVLVGLAGVALGFPKADAIAAMIVAVFVCIAGWRLGRRTIDTLTDTAPEGVARQIAEITTDIPGVIEVERVRIRPVGDKIFTELKVAMSRTLPIDRMAAIKAAINDAIVSEIPRAEVSVTAEPRALDNETVTERVMVTARNRALAVHHVTVHAIGGRLMIALDLEVDGGLTLARAHEIASGLEHALAEELGAEVEIETHIEPLQPDDLAGSDADPARIREVLGGLTELARGIGTVGDVHNVRVRETADGEIVNFHCRVDAHTSVRLAHEKVDDLERALRRRWPQIKRAIGHTEPVHH